MKEQIHIIYEKDIEYLLAAMEILTPFQLNKKVRECYHEDFISEKKKHFPLLFEVYQSFSEKGTAISMMEFLLECDMKHFSLESYFSHIKSLEKEVFLSGFLGESPEKIREILSTENGVLDFYQSREKDFTSFLVVETLFHKTEWFIDTYYGFVKELSTPEAAAYLEKFAPVITEELQKLQTGVKTDGALGYAERIMEKTFYNRGPYEIYYFMPSIFMPFRCCRWYERNQFLIYDAFGGKDRESMQMAELLKIMADPTRYKILALLKEKKHLNGIELAENLKLSTSTISHHMSQLKNGGLIHEEPVGNTKYYSLNEVAIKNCIETLEKTFL